MSGFCSLVQPSHATVLLLHAIATVFATVASKQLQ